ncbi:MAG: hypothetical protein FJX62_18045 [Alphaproteobacteria bacterium]|nr:hypothetical protein [Alphaproteobacteria bacterium]
MRASIAYSLRDPRTPGGAHADVLRWSLVRKINTIMGHPARCKDAACRRAKACVGPDVRCDREIPPRQVSEEQGERNLAFFQRELRRRVEEDASARERFAANATPAPAAASRRRSRASNPSAGRP